MPASIQKSPAGTVGDYFLNEFTAGTARGGDDFKAKVRRGERSEARRERRPEAASRCEHCSRRLDRAQREAKTPSCAA